jgi:predicted nucleotidyltransferase
MALAPLTLSTSLGERVIGLAIFGSYGRGDFDLHSDLDLLVVVRDGSGTTLERGVVDAVEPVLPKQPSVSFYGEQ